MRPTRCELALMVVGVVLLAAAWWLHRLAELDRRGERVCPPYYECNGPPATRHPRCCPET